MLKRTYEWGVWDALKEGKTVYAVELLPDRPRVCNMSDCTVQEAAEIIGRNESGKTCEYYVVEDEPEEVAEDEG